MSTNARKEFERDPYNCFSITAIPGGIFVREAYGHTSTKK